jgi:hypothetical protein
VSAEAGALADRIARLLAETHPDRFAARKYLPADVLWTSLSPTEQAAFDAALARLVDDGRAEIAELALLSPAGGDAATPPSGAGLIGRLAPDQLGVRLRADPRPAPSSQRPAALGAGNTWLAVIFLSVVIVGVALLASGALSTRSLDGAAEQAGGLEALLFVECPDTLVSRIEQGMRVDVCAASGVTLRAAPSLTAQRVTAAEPGAAMLVIEGPVCPDEHVWWQVRAENDDTGWVREGNADGDAYLCPQ